MSGDELAGGSPRLDAFDITRRAREAYGPDGRLPLSEHAWWPIFPFDTDGLRMQEVRDPELPEPPRDGDEGPEGCRTCTRRAGDWVWSDERWLVGMSSTPQSVPGLTLHTRAHLDFGDLTDELGAELGVLLVRGQRALGSIPGVGRVHVYKWGDGSAHLHIFLLARPAGMVQLKGMYLTTWMFALPALPADEWAAMRRHVAAALSITAED